MGPLLLIGTALALDAPVHSTMVSGIALASAKGVAFDSGTSQVFITDDDRDSIYSYSDWTGASGGDVIPFDEQFTIGDQLGGLVYDEERSVFYVVIGDDLATLNSSGTELERIRPLEGHGPPSDVTMVEGEVFVIEHEGSGLIRGFDPGSWTLTTEYPLPSPLDWPSIAYDVDNEVLWLSHWNGGSSSDWIVLDPADGDLVDSFSSSLGATDWGHGMDYFDCRLWIATETATEDGTNVFDINCDRDEDGVPNSEDNCPDTENPEQTDSDGDGFGDACEPDSDGDGWGDDSDCAPDDPDIHPGADEVCDEIDNNCDDIIDGEGAIGAMLTHPDDDGDGYGDEGVDVYTCVVEEGHTIDGTDCNDDNPSTYPGADEICDGEDNDCDGDLDDDVVDGLIWYADTDEDGYGHADSTREECTAPDGFVANDDDCDDSSADVHPGVDEVCNEIDDDCNGTVDDDAIDGSTWYIDYDSDGYGSPRFSVSSCSAPYGYVATSDDCDDTRRDTHPGATELCDGLDNDCDTEIDGPTTLGAIIWYTDEDGDGYGDAGATTFVACDAPPGTSHDASDCDDGNPDTYPGADEICDGFDNNCNDIIDEESATDAATWYRDVDGDGYGEASDPAPGCSEPEGYAALSGDCDPFVGEVYPGADETCNERDDDCDGEVDEDAVDKATYYIDYDGDGYGSDTYTTEACAVPEGYTADHTDCDDLRLAVYPDAPEFCDGLDNDCDGEADEDSAEDLLPFYADNDRDGYADESTLTMACEAPPDHISALDSLGWDCDDLDDTVFPGADEVWYDGIDQNCDMQSDFDADEDGHDAIEPVDTGDPEAEPGDDCDDTNEAVYPGAEETWYDGTDQDCDGESDYDADQDGFDSLSFGGEDCDDADPSTYPGAPDNPDDDRINDCSEVEEDDADGDGYTSIEAGGDDCDDGNSTIHPDADDPDGDGIDQDCDGVDGIAGADTGSADTGSSPEQDTGDSDTDTPSTGDSGSADSDPDSDDGDDPEEEGVGRSKLPETKRCGCATQTHPSGAVFPWLLIGWVARRRQTS